MKNKKSIVILVVGFFLSLTACGLSSGNKRDGEPLQVLNREKVNVMIAGDSTVSTWASDRAERGWGQMIPDYFDERVRVDNRAVPGRSTKTFISEGDWEKLLESLASGDYVLIQFGHNDSHDPSSPEATDPFGDYQEFLMKYIDDARSKGAIPILVTPMYRRSFDRDGKLRPYLMNEQGNPIYNLQPYAKAMKQVAEVKEVALIDLFSMSGDLLQALGDEGSAEFLVPNDRAHWNQKGAVAMASLVSWGIAEGDSSLKAYLLPGVIPATSSAESEAKGIRALNVSDTQKINPNYSGND